MAWRRKKLTISTVLARLHPVLAEMVPIVCRIENVGIVQLTRLLELLNQIPNHIVNSLQSTHTAALELVNIVNDSLIQLRDPLNPANSAINLFVKALIPRHLEMLEHIGMARRILRLTEPVGIACRIMRAISMRRIGCNSQHPWTILLHGLVQESSRFLGEHVRRVVPLITDRWVAVAGHTGLVVAVGERVQEEVRPIEATCIGLVVVGLGMGVPQLPDVVRVVPGVLHPQWKIVVVPASRHHLWISTVGGLNVRHVGVMRHAAGPEICA